MSKYIDYVCSLTDEQLDKECDKVIANNEKEKANVIRLVAMIRLTMREYLQK